jgi:putative membrane protein
MFGTRLIAATAATLVGASLLLAQQPPSQPQGETLPGQQPQVNPPASPTAPAPVAPPATALPGQPQQNPAQPIPVQQPNQIQPNQVRPNNQVQPNQVQPTQVQPNPGQPAQIQPGQPVQNQPIQQQQPRDNSQNSQQSQNRDNSQQASSEDAKFLVKAAEIDLAVINIGRLSTQRGSRQDVREFANRLVQDHSANLNQVNQLCNRNNWKSGERMDQEHQQLFQKLAVMQGPQFDQAFLNHAAEGHKKGVEFFKNASENCKNADVKQFATQTLAAVRQHEQELQRLVGQNQNQNQGQTTSPTSNQNNDANRTDGARNNTTPRNDQNRNDSPNREDRTPPDRRDDR